MSEPTWTAKMFDENKRLKATIAEMAAALKMFPGATADGLIGAVADVYPYRMADFLRMREAVLKEKT